MKTFLKMFLLSCWCMVSVAFAKEHLDDIKAKEAQQYIQMKENALNETSNEVDVEAPVSPKKAKNPKMNPAFKIADRLEGFNNNINLNEISIDDINKIDIKKAEGMVEKLATAAGMSVEKFIYYYDLKVNPPQEDPYNSRDCVDTNYDADGNVLLDAFGDGCADYVSSWCGGWDTDVFSSNDMCCVCGGGMDDGSGDGDGSDDENL